MAILFSPIPAEQGTPQPAEPGAAEPKEDLLLVAGFGNPTAADYVTHVCGQGSPNVILVADADVCRRVEGPAQVQPLDSFSRAALHTLTQPARVPAVVLFLNPRLTGRDRAVLDDLFNLASEREAEFVAVVSTFWVHLGDRVAAEAEDYALSRAEHLPARTVVFRPGHVLSPSSRTSAWLRRLAFCHPLVPGRLRSCFVEGDELFAAIESERRESRPRRSRVYTLLGPNRPWKALLEQYQAPGFLRTCLTAASTLLALLLVGHLAGLVLGLLARRRPALRRWNLDTLRPKSLRELLALYNKYNYRHVKVVGYNNGVNHFGQQYPGQTVISTVYCDGIVRAGPDVIKADCGVTIRKALDFLAGAGQALHVVPNYSYVCLGTAFFVPIHGSAADFSTVADTITRVVLYDPRLDRLIATRRNEPAFRDHVYNLEADVLLLRLYLRVKPKSRYYVHVEELQDPGSKALLSALRDDRSTNVEIRKSHAASGSVKVYRYYQDPGETASPVLELPRDALGRLWDRLEENRISSFLMHAFGRHCVWHVELFFTAEEFALFWESHRTLPLRKIQLRYIRRDGFPHSPFREHDCVSADLFMFRRHRHTFEDYLKQTFAIVRSNPGKHSR